MDSRKLPQKVHGNRWKLMPGWLQSFAGAPEQSFLNWHFNNLSCLILFVCELLRYHVRYIGWNDGCIIWDSCRTLSILTAVIQTITRPVHVTFGYASGRSVAAWFSQSADRSCTGKQNALKKSTGCLLRRFACHFQRFCRYMLFYILRIS